MTRVTLLEVSTFALTSNSSLQTGPHGERLSLRLHLSNVSKDTDTDTESPSDRHRWFASQTTPLNRTSTEQNTHLASPPTKPTCRSCNDARVWVETCHIGHTWGGEDGDARESQPVSRLRLTEVFWNSNSILGAVASNKGIASNRGIATSSKKLLV